MNADEILDQIDHALHDWEVSDDAMRWTPEESPTTPPPGRGALPDLMFFDEAHTWTRPFADMSEHIAAAQRFMREHGIACWQPPPPAPRIVGPVTVGFDVGSDGDSALSVAYADEAGRIYLNTWTTNLNGTPE